MRESDSARFFDFTGGLNTKASVTSISPNQALDSQNINILPSGGFEKRRGNSTYNSSAMGSGAAVTGGGYYRQSDGDEWLLSISGTKIYKSEFDGTMDDITGAVTITTGATNIWTSGVMNNMIIFCGGSVSVDVPIKWAGSGNAAALGGSPPAGEFGLTANNRFFIGSTSANPSRIYWSILGNPEDWTGTGSGSQDVSANDGDTLVGAALMSYDHLFLFKQNSIHDLAIRSSPFPIYPVFRNVGAVSKRGIVTADGIVYFITPEPRMKATDGSQIFDFPDYIDDIWDGLNKSRLKYINGVLNKRLSQIWWFVSDGTSTTNDLCIVWDLKRRAWLRNPTGFKFNTSIVSKDRVIYGGGYDGKLYETDVDGVYQDASESGAAINAYWRSGWMDFGKMLETKTIPYAGLNFETQTSGTFEFGYGHDFVQDAKILSISMQSPGGLWDQMLWDVGLWGIFSDTSRLVFMRGNGKFFQFLIRNSNADGPFLFNGLEMPLKFGPTTTLKQ